MSHPVLWPKKIYFYPIGNTVPICLTQNLPPEQSTNVLLLGCGDPRNILYTLFAGATSPGRLRTLDFTCCDYEPAVLARNALLFTLIADGHPVDRIWNIFYHIRLDDNSLSLLIQQCEKLVSMSRDLQSWAASPYSAFLRMCSRHTLSQLHDHWQLYALARTLLKGRNESLFAEFIRQFEAKGDGMKQDLPAVRSAGPFSLETIQVLGLHFEQYWRTGTVFPDAKEAISTPFVNPTFIYSLTGEGCAVHYATYPLQCFHLASAFAESSSVSAHPKKAIQYGELLSCARLQFQQWCDSFATAVSSDSLESVTIRLFSGDALALCRTLYHCHVTSSTSASLFVSAWAGNDLVLDGGDYGVNPTSAAPTTFDVIETSNIADHVGLMNVLVAAIPILSRRPSSTLYTETFLVKGKDTEVAFVQRLCAEIPAISLLFGIAPTAYVSNFTSHSNVHELMLFHGFDAQRCYEQIVWKTPYLGDVIAGRQCGENMLCSSWEPSELAQLLFNIYYRLFSDEDLAKNIQTHNIPESLIHYHRGTFAALLGLVKSRVDVAWEVVMERIFDLLESDRKLILGSNNYQELCCQLHIRGIYSVSVYSLPPQSISGTDWSRGRFQGWKNVPPVVCLILVIPREKVKILEDMDSDTVGSPMLQCNIRSSTFHNIFTSIQFTFGTVSIVGSQCNARAVLNEDPRGWSGAPSLVMSVWVPSFNLACNPLSTQIGLGVHSAPHNMLMVQLGLHFNLFTASLMDRDSVHIVSERPHHPTELSDLRASMPHSPATAFQRVSVALDKLKVSSLAARWEITDGSLSFNSPETVQISPCAMKVTLGKRSNNLVYPFPIDGTRSKLRVARKSGWIEVVVPLSDPHTSSGFTVPVLLSADGPPTIWNVHRVNLERLPIFDTQKSHDRSDWICQHVFLALSDRERTLLEQANEASPLVDILTQVKHSLCSLFVRASEPNAKRIFGLTAPSCGIYTIVFLNHIRLDLASNTLVADTCVLPLTQSRSRLLSKYLAGITRGEQMMLINTSEMESQNWKRLIPVFVERCRTWIHTPTCQYLEAGTVPLSVELDQNPICACGEGKEGGIFPSVDGWKKLAPYVTRAAFSPLFAASFLESVGGLLKAIQAPGAPSAGNVAACCTHCGKPEERGKRLLKCSRCKVSGYCGQACQRADWKQHKTHCRA